MNKNNSVEGEVNTTIKEFSHRLGICMKDLTRIQNELWNLKVNMDKGNK
jgi:hypothetical protein